MSLLGNEHIMTAVFPAVIISVVLGAIVAVAVYYYFRVGMNAALNLNNPYIGKY
jgi:hypothetical protein